MAGKNAKRRAKAAKAGVRSLEKLKDYDRVCKPESLQTIINLLDAATDLVERDTLMTPNLSAAEKTAVSELQCRVEEKMKKRAPGITLEMMIKETKESIASARRKLCALHDDLLKTSNAKQVKLMLTFSEVTSVCVRLNNFRQSEEFKAKAVEYEASGENLDDLVKSAMRVFAGLFDGSDVVATMT